MNSPAGIDRKYAIGKLLKNAVIACSIHFVFLFLMSGKPDNRDRWGWFLLLSLPLLLSLGISSFLNPKVSRRLNRGHFHWNIRLIWIYIGALLLLLLLHPVLGYLPEINTLSSLIRKIGIPFLVFQGLLIGSIVWQVFSPARAGSGTGMNLSEKEKDRLKTEAVALKENWMDLLGENKLRELFAAIDRFFGTHQLDSETFVLLQNQWKKTEQDRLTNIISTQEAQQQHAKVIKGLIDLIDELTET